MFSDYISHILPELGEENIKEMSFDLFAYKQLELQFLTAKTAMMKLNAESVFPHKASLAEEKQSHGIYKSYGTLSGGTGRPADEF